MIKWKKIGDLGSFYGGLTGKTKEDFIDGNAKFITYMNVFACPSLDTSSNGTVRIIEGEKQNKVKRGDILFTGSSETQEEAGMSCVVTEDLQEDYYLNSFCFGLRLYQPELFDVDFLKHLFRAYSIRKEIIKSASGVTRFNISKERFANVQIPILLLSEQQRIADILDSFMRSVENLRRQIAERKKQYECFREKWLDLEGKCEKEIRSWGSFSEIGKGNGVQKADFVDQGLGCIHYGQIYTTYGPFTYNTKKYVSREVFDKARKASTGDLIMTDTSETVEDICKSVAYLGNEDIAISNHTFIIKHKQNPKFLSYSTQTYSFLHQKRKYVSSGKVSSISSQSLAKIRIYLPTLSEQQRIVENLDVFVASIKNLEAQLELRQKEYEFYRNKLLTFDK